MKRTIIELYKQTFIGKYTYRNKYPNLGPSNVERSWSPRNILTIFLS